MNENICPHCKNNLSGNSQSCNHCGAGFDTIDTSQGISLGNSATSRSSVLYILWNIFSILLITTLAGTIIILLSRSMQTVEKSNFVDPRDLISYPIIKVGRQTWLAKNLDTDRYQNGDIIPQVSDDKEWARLTTGAWCYYENNSVNGKLYGKLYNLYALTDKRGLAPKGWHVATKTEFEKLVDYLNPSIAGIRLKDHNLWNETQNSYEEIGFNAAPGGLRFGGYGNFIKIRVEGDWWLMGNDLISSGYFFQLEQGKSRIFKEHQDANSGLSVRCVKDR